MPGRQVLQASEDQRPPSSLSPGLANKTCQEYSGLLFDQDFVSYQSGCIWPLAVSCSLIKPLTNTTVGVYTINFADPPSSEAVLAEVPLCNSTYTADMTTAYKSGKLNATAQNNVAAIAKNAAALLSSAGGI
ncbi:hypothetical protein WJX73_002231 [Symbiochloris irregularis]|uniref:Uncharacterized protein n=1 Tax=Symbiochloris irregularis TaxID=706552 RepID=A0AAW1NSW5_9CHLO